VAAPRNKRRNLKGDSPGESRAASLARKRTPLSLFE